MPIPVEEPLCVLDESESEESSVELEEGIDEFPGITSTCISSLLLEQFFDQC